MQSLEGVTGTLLVVLSHSIVRVIARFVVLQEVQGASYLDFMIPRSITDAFRAWRCTGKVEKGLVSCLERNCGQVESADALSLCR